MTETYIQVCGCMEQDGFVVPFVSNSSADYYGVYICDPLAKWLADFRDVESALAYADHLADINDFEVDNRTYSD